MVEPPQIFGDAHVYRSMRHLIDDAYWLRHAIKHTADVGFF